VDRLTVTGLGRHVDGAYDCDLTALLVDVTSPDALRVREAELVKRVSGAYGYGVAEAFLAGDWSVQMAVALVVLARNGVTVSEKQAWDATVGAFAFRLDDTPPVGQGDDVPADPPQGATTPSENGGGSGDPTSEPNPETPPGPTGRLESVA
jgi:hypothetical protein